MLRLRDIMNRDVITVDENATLREVIDVLTTRGIGGAPVVRGRTVVGVISGTDILDFAAATRDAADSHAPLHLTADERDPLDEHGALEVMTHSILALPPEAPVKQAADEMRTAGVHRLLVMEGETLLGIVTTMDVADAVADHRLTARTYVFDRPARRDR